MCYRKKLLRAITEHDVESIKSIGHEIEMDQILEEQFPEEVFAMLLNIIQEPAFLGLEGSWLLLRIFEYDAEKLTKEQKPRLLAVLESIFAGFADWHGPFYISEILDSISHGEEALSLWKRMMTIGEEIPRSFVPHGLEHLIQASEDPAISNEAFSLLMSMSQDNAESVRNECLISLSRLSAAGYAVPEPQ